MCSSHLPVSAKEEGVGNAAARDFLCVSRQNGVDGRICISNRGKRDCGSQSSWLRAMGFFSLGATAQILSQPFCPLSPAVPHPHLPCPLAFWLESLAPRPISVILLTSFLMYLFQFPYANTSNMNTCPNFPLITVFISCGY